MLFVRVRALAGIYIRYGTNAVQFACWQPTAVTAPSVASPRWIYAASRCVRVTLSRFTALLWIAVRV